MHPHTSLYENSTRRNAVKPSRDGSCNMRARSSADKFSCLLHAGASHSVMHMRMCST